MKNKVKNKLEWWMLELKYRHQKDFAPLIGVTQYQLSRYINQKEQPTRDMLVRIWLKMKKHFPERCKELHIEDLLEIKIDDAD